MTSCNSDSKILSHYQYMIISSAVRGPDTPVEVLGSADSDDGVGIGQTGEDAQPRE